MPHSKKFETIDSETGKTTEAKVKVDENGVVTGFLHGIEHDKEGGKHGHVWNLDKEPEEIGGRDPKDANNKSIYEDDKEKDS